MDIPAVILLLVVLGVCVWLFLYVILPMIPLPSPFAQVITALVWLLVAYVIFMRVLEPLLGHMRL